MPVFTPISPEALRRSIADRVGALPGRLAVAVAGADAAEPVRFAEPVAQSLRVGGRPAAVVSLHDYIRPASLRLEYGRDEYSYRTAWFDYAAVEREVLQSLRSRGRWLPALWDERSDRSARAVPQAAAPDTVVFVAGPMLLGRGLSFDLTVELRLSDAALRRRIPPHDQFTVDGIARHSRDHPEEPDLLVAWDHCDRPAIRL